MNRSSSIVRRATSTFAVSALAFGSAAALGVSAAAAPGDDVTLAVSQDSGLSNGDTVTVTGEGADPELGYYLSTCVIGTQGPTGPDCAGGPSDQNASVWVSNNPSANVPINSDGTFTAELAVTQTGETMSKVAIDCDETPCAVTLFGDHRNGFGYTTGTPIGFGAATAPAAGDSADGTLLAESSADSGSNAAWWIVGGVVVVAVGGGGAVAYSRRP